MTNKIPQGWVECELEKCIQKINTRNKVKQKEYLDEGLFPVIDQGQKSIGGYSNRTDFVINIDTPVIVFGDHTRCFKYIDFNFIAGADGTKIIKPLQFFDEKLFYYFCQVLKFPNKGYARHFQYLLKSIIRIPPLNEQKRIVEKIEEEFEKIDEGVEKLKLAQEQIKQYRQSVLKFAFEGKLTVCEMKSIMLSEVGEIITGTTPSTKVSEYYNNNDFPFYKPTDLNNGYNTSSAICYVSKFAYENHRKLPINSILVTCIGATIGKTGIIRETGICNQQINAIIPDKEFVPEYIYFQCISEYFQEQIKTNASATTLPILNKSGFSKLKFKTCKLDEQKQIVKEIEKHFEVADEAERVIAENLEKAEQLKQSILKKAFEGRLVPQNPSDEPASVLLERIKSKRSK